MILRNIELYRGELKYSKPTVAALANIPPTTWYRRLKDPDGFTVRELRSLAEALQITLAKLVS